MKTYSIKLISAGILLLVIISACKKKEDLDAPYRIISEKNYYNNVLGDETTFEYTNNKLSKIINSGGDMNGEILVTYPDENTIVGTRSNEEITTFTLTDNRITEVLEGTDSRMTITYNSAGDITNMKEYYNSDVWILSSEMVFTYVSGQLTEILETEYGSQMNYEYRSTFSYSGDELIDQISSYKPTGGDWIDFDKYGYSYTDGKVSKITHFYQGQTDWEESWSELFTYDSNGNLVEINDENGEVPYRTEYTYEEGSGNYRLIYEIMEYEFMYPMPTKKSQTPVTRNSDHIINPKTLFGKRLF